MDGQLAPFEPMSDGLTVASDMTPARAEPRKLTKGQKAAIIVRLILSRDDPGRLKTLETGNMVRLARTMSELAFVDEATTMTVIDEFLAEFESLSMYFRPGLAEAKKILSPMLNDDAKELLAGPKDIEIPTDPWEDLAELDSPRLIPILIQQTPQIVALTLAKLPSSKSAEILDGLPEGLARGATLAAAQSARLDYNTMREIGRSLANLANAGSDRGALPGDPIERVGNILNFAPGGLRDMLLTHLEAEDPKLVEQMRRVMFTFADIPDRLDVADVPKVVRGMENSVLITALAGGQQTEKATVDFLMNNLSKRLAEQLEEEVAAAGEVRARDAETAMNEVIRAIRDLEATGEVILVMPEED